MGAEPWELDEKIMGLAKILGHRTRRCKTVDAPPSSGFIDFAPRARLDPDRERQDQPYFRSSANNSSAEMPSSRSASYKASSSSIWSNVDR